MIRAASGVRQGSTTSITAAAITRGGTARCKNGDCLPQRRRASSTPTSSSPRQTPRCARPLMFSGATLRPLGRAFAEQALWSEDEDQDQDREDDRLCPGRAGRVPRQSLVEVLYVHDPEPTE